MLLIRPVVAPRAVATRQRTLAVGAAGACLLVAAVFVAAGAGRERDSALRSWSNAADDGAGVLGVVVGDGGAVKHAGRGRPKGSKNRPAGSPGRGGVGRVGAKGAGGRPRAEADTSKATRGGVVLSLIHI